MLDRTSNLNTADNVTGRVAPGLFSISFLVLLIGHFAIDTYSAIVPAILNVLEFQFRMTAEQSAWLLGIGSISSGLSQPFFAWIADRLNTRIFGAMGLVLGSVLICSIELISAQYLLFLFYIVGMVGIGMFHPIAVALVGQINPLKRSVAVSWFFVFGMMGGVSGSIIGPMLITRKISLFEQGLPLLIPAGLILAFAFHGVIRSLNRHESLATSSGRKSPNTTPPIERKHQVFSVGLLYVAAALRFFVNMAVVYLFVRWVGYQMAATHHDWTAARIAAETSIYVGNLNAMMVLGMAIGGFCSGMLIPLGKEKLPLIIVPILFCPAIAFFPLVPFATLGMLFALLAGIGFASMVPITISLAQRLMPGRANLASGLVLGGTWSVGMFGPPFVQFLLDRFSFTIAFAVAAGLLAISGLIMSVLPTRAIAVASQS